MNDTTLLSPELLTAWGDRLLIVEREIPQVRAFSLEGEPLWVYGQRGGGPGELEWVSYIAPSPSGTLWIVDSRNAKVVEIDTAGRLVEERSTKHFPVSPGPFSFTPEGDVIFTTQSPGQGYIVASSDSLEILRTLPFPWGDTIDARYNVRIAPAADPETGTLVQALMYGPGFALLRPNADRPEVFEYIDPIPLARKASPALSRARADSARYGALSAAVGDGEIYFLFGGRPKRDAHDAEPTVLVDVYGLDGAYRRSYLLPIDTEEFALLDGNRFAVAGLHDGLLPRIYILRPRPGSSDSP